MTITPTDAGMPTAESGFDRARAHEAAEGLIAAGRGLSLGGMSLRDLVNEGRR